MTGSFLGSKYCKQIPSSSVLVSAGTELTLFLVAGTSSYFFQEKGSTEQRSHIMHCSMHRYMGACLLNLLQTGGTKWELDIACGLLDTS